MSGSEKHGGHLIVPIADVPGFNGLMALASAVGAAIEANADVQDICFDCRGVIFVEPPLLVSLAAGMAFVQEVHEKPAKLIPPQDRSVQQYLANIGFIEKFIATNTGLSKQPMAHAIEVQRFDTADQAAIVGVVDCFEQHLHGVSDLRGNMESTFAELMDNVSKHSGSPVGGFLTGQFYPQLKRLRFAVCDFGVTIPYHLSLALEPDRWLGDADVIVRALEYAVSGATSGDHFGAGLPFVRDFTILIGGRLRIYSRRGAVFVDGSGVRRMDVAESYPGTLITFDWPTR